MTRPTCHEQDCERAPVRTRDGQRWCLFHPDSQPPAVDAKGKVVEATPLTRAPRAATGYRAPGRVRVTPRATETPPADGLCGHDGCPRPWKHRGIHTKPKTAKQPRPAHEPRPALVRGGPCARDTTCTRPNIHTGRCAHPKPARTPAPRNVLDEVDACRRYQNGEGLFDLAADLHIGAKRLRDILTRHDVPIRGRGQVLHRKPPAPIDPDECRRLYLDEGMTSGEIGRHLRVKTQRVQDLLRHLGILRPPGGRPPGDGSLNSVRVKLNADQTAAVRLWAAELGQTMQDYLTSLIKADLHAQGRWPSQLAAVYDQDVAS